MLVVLGLIDVVMISNLLIMVIVGGYETFVSRMDLESHPDQPEWLSHVNASVLKVKLATAIIGISSIHLLKTFINAASYETKVLIAQTVIHITFLLSALAIAAVDRIMPADAARTDGTATQEHASHDRRSSQQDFIQSVADALQYISYYHPLDYIAALGEAYEAEAVAGGEGRDRADPHQLADVRRRPPADLPGHGHRRRLRQGRHGRALGRRHDVDRRHGQRRRAPRLQRIRTTRCARRSSPIPPARARTRRTTRRRSSTSTSCRATRST